MRLRRVATWRWPKTVAPHHFYLSAVRQVWPTGTPSPSTHARIPGSATK